VNSAPVGGASYADGSVQNGQTYYYVATAVDGSGNESVYSNEVAATVP
jgi:fibronectin type 3 domain-containing protein